MFVKSNADLPGGLHDNDLMIAARRRERLVFAIFFHRRRRLYISSSVSLLHTTPL